MFMNQLFLDRLLDLRGFKLHDGRTLLIESANEDLDFMTQIRDTSCARFTTVLGPGSDGYHQTHMHVDLEVRHNGYRICQRDGIASANSHLGSSFANDCFERAP